MTVLEVLEKKYGGVIPDDKPRLAIGGKGESVDEEETEEKEDELQQFPDRSTD